VPIREELNQPIFRRILARAIAEGLATLKQAGIKPQKLGKAHPSIIPHVLRLPTRLFRIVASSMIKIDPQARSSMWEDLERKRMTEIDYLNGEIVRLAQQHNIQVPCNETIVKLIREAEQKRAGSPCLPANQIWQMM
jgi:2-dehydropantoate 2-reductase